MGKEKLYSNRHTIPVSVALRAIDLERIQAAAYGVSRSAFIRTAVNNELARMEGLDESVTFDSASFLNHHWFENGLYGMTFSGEWNPNMTWKRTKDRLQGCMTSIAIDLPAKNHVPDDIMEWLDHFMRHIEREFQLLDDAGRKAYAKVAIARYRDLAKKYDAH